MAFPCKTKSAPGQGATHRRFSLFLEEAVLSTENHVSSRFCGTRADSRKKPPVTTEASLGNLTPVH